MENTYFGNKCYLDGLDLLPSIYISYMLWDMLNIKSYSKRIRVRKCGANCFESVSDPRLVRMEPLALLESV